MSEQSNPFDNFLTKREFCDAVPGGGITPRTADRWNSLSIGPRRVKVGKFVLYRRSDVASWLARLAEEGEQGN